MASRPSPNNSVVPGRHEAGTIRSSVARGEVAMAELGYRSLGRAADLKARASHLDPQRIRDTGDVAAAVSHDCSRTNGATRRAARMSFPANTNADLDLPGPLECRVSP